MLEKWLDCIIYLFIIKVSSASTLFLGRQIIHNKMQLSFLRIFFQYSSWLNFLFDLYPIFTNNHSFIVAHNKLSLSLLWRFPPFIFHSHSTIGLFISHGCIKWFGVSITTRIHSSSAIFLSEVCWELYQSYCSLFICLFFQYPSSFRFQVHMSLHSTPCILLGASFPKRDFPFNFSNYFLSYSSCCHKFLRMELKLPAGSPQMISYLFNCRVFVLLIWNRCCDKWSGNEVWWANRLT